MKEIAAAIEYHGLDAGRDRPLRDQLAHRLSRRDVGTRLEIRAQRLVDRRGRRKEGKKK